MLRWCLSVSYVWLSFCLKWNIQTRRIKITLYEKAFCNHYQQILYAFQTFQMYLNEVKIHTEYESTLYNISFLCLWLKIKCINIFSYKKTCTHMTFYLSCWFHLAWDSFVVGVQTCLFLSPMSGQSENGSRGYQGGTGRFQLGPKKGKNLSHFPVI